MTDWPSSTRAELAAIFTALCTVPRNCPYIIHTDSQAAIDGIMEIRQTISSLRKWHRYCNKSLKWAILHLIESRNTNVSFIKVMRHSGNSLNDTADQLAKEGVDSIDRLDTNRLVDSIDLPPIWFQCIPK